MSEATVVTPVTVNPALQEASQKVQAAFAPLFGLMQNSDFCHMLKFAETHPIPKVDLTEDGCGIIIKYLPTGHTRDLLEASPIMGICHQLKHLFNDGDRIGKTGIEQKKKDGHRLENDKLRMCISYTSLVRMIPHVGNEVTIKFYVSQPENARVKESFRRSDVSDEQLRELKDSGRLICHNRSKVIAWKFLSDQERQDLLAVIITTCAEEVRDYIQEAYSSAYQHGTAPNYLLEMTPPRSSNNLIPLAHRGSSPHNQREKSA